MAQVALITGGLGDIGLAVARQFAAQGVRTALLDNNPARTETVVHELAAQVVITDLTTAVAVRGVVEQVLRVSGPINYLVNCAGIMRWTPTVDIAEDEWDAVLNINLKGTFLVCQQVARAMIEVGQGGRIVNISSGLALRPNPELAHYAASKAGVIAFSKVLALELGRHRINVNCVAPGMVDTQLIVGKRDRLAIAEYAERTPLGQVVGPDDVADAVLYLCSPQSWLITGQTLFLNGGGLMP